MTEEEKQKKAEAEKAKAALEKKRREELFERECRILAGMLYHPKKYYKMVRQVGLQSEDFTDGIAAVAFNAILALGDAEEDAQRRIDLVAAESEDLARVCTTIAKYQEEPARIEDMALVRQTNALSRYRQRLKDIFNDEQLSFPARAESLKLEMERLYSDHLTIAKALDGNASGKPEIYALPEHLTRVPGVIDLLMKATMKVSHHPNRVIAFGGALALMAHLMGRRYKAPDNTRPNIYLILLSGSGNGKNDPIMLATALLYKLGMLDGLSTKTASAQALEDKIIENPCVLFMRDEIDTLFNQLNIKGNNQAEELQQTLLNIFSANKGIYFRRDKAKTGKGPETKYNNVHSPSLTILGTGIPRFFYQSLTERTIANGMLARCIVVESGRRGDDNPDPGGDIELPEDLMNAVKTILNKVKPVLPTEEPKVCEIQYRDGAKKELAAIRAFERQKRDKYEDERNEVGMACWNRFVEMSMKLAMIYAVSENPEFPSISVEGLRWASELMECTINRSLDNVARYVGGNELDELTLKVLEMIQQAGSAGIMRSDVMNNIGRLNAKSMDLIEQTLVDRGEMTVTLVGRNKRGKLYRAVLKAEGK